MVVVVVVVLLLLLLAGSDDLRVDMIEQVDINRTCSDIMRY